MFRIFTRSPARKLLLSAVAFLWLGAVAGGFAAAVRFEVTQGAPASLPREWPAAAPIARDAGLPTLLVFVHPRCPCTTATVGELARLLAHCGDKVRTVVLCYSDPALGPDWAHTGTWSQAAAIPGVAVREDPLGAAARAFGAATSGQVCLYSRDGELRFEGGITPSRGHAGDNRGADALAALLLGGTGPDTSAVFGCSLLGPAEGGR